MIIFFFRHVKRIAMGVPEDQVSLLRIYRNATFVHLPCLIVVVRGCIIVGFTFGRNHASHEAWRRIRGRHLIRHPFVLQLSPMMDSYLAR